MRALIDLTIVAIINLRLFHAMRIRARSRARAEIGVSRDETRRFYFARVDKFADRRAISAFARIFHVAFAFADARHAPAGRGSFVRSKFARISPGVPAAEEVRARASFAKISRSCLRA